MQINLSFFLYTTSKTHRSREENYQKNQSPRQKWNSAAFAYANRELAKLRSFVSFLFLFLSPGMSEIGKK